ncbi:MAG: PQQ-dependent sugar dehydrogenase, partial [Planctomycetota bacterium]|nr:PQQ-dependent sugar dehydrogenase [Planctomycetota bacterium]
SYTGDELLDGDKVAFAGTPSGGEQLPSNISLMPSGSRGDVEAVGAYDGTTGTWTVEFRRLRDTGDGAADHSFEGAGAIPPATPLILTGDPVLGESLYSSSGAGCQSCHALDGVGIASGSTWAVPRVQRASGSQITQALADVPAMSWLMVSEQETEDIAAFLQTKATFAPSWTVDVVVNGPPDAGIITSSPPGIDCAGTCSAQYLDGTNVTLQAASVPGWTFTGWSGPCSGTGPCSFTVNSDVQVTANYQVQSTNWTLTVVNGGGGQVKNNNGSVVCPGTCTEVLGDGSWVDLEAIPDPNYMFSGWTTGPCTGGSGNCAFNITQDETVTALFTPVACGTVIYDQGGTNGFGRELVITEDSVNNPTDMAFLPNDADAFLVTGQTGRVYYFDDWACAPVNEVNIQGVLPVDGTGGERGLLALALHPDFASNGLVFFYHTSTDQLVNSVSRMTASFPAGNLQLSDAVRIIDFRKIGAAGNHNGGDIVFAPDGTLLAAVGEGGGPSHSASGLNTNLLACVVRIEPKLAAGVGGYDIPAGNMFNAGNAQCSDVTSSNSACPEILAMGLRNPFRISMADNVVYIGEVGTNYEELNTFDYTDNTVDFGWPGQDGPGGGAGLTDPLLAYQRSDNTSRLFREDDPMGTMTGCISVISGPVYRAAGGDRYNGLLTDRLLFTDWFDAFVRGLGVDSSGNATGLDLHLVHREGVTAMVEGPDGYIYLLARKATNSGCQGADTAAIYRLVLP